MLLRQSQMKVEYSASQAYLQESTDKLQRIMADVTENADIITYAILKSLSIICVYAFVIAIIIDCINVCIYVDIC